VEFGGGLSVTGNTTMTGTLLIRNGWNVPQMLSGVGGRGGGWKISFQNI